MKKLITLVTAFTLFALSAFAGPAGPEEVKKYHSQHFTYGLAFNKIVVEDDIDLVVYENATTNIQFDGSKENIAKVQWEVRKGVLYIKSKAGSLKNKVIVTLDVAGLSEITIEGKSSVRSLGNLNSPSLNIYLKAGCFVAIKNYGAINIINTEGSEMNVMEQKGNISIS